MPRFDDSVRELRRNLHLLGFFALTALAGAAITYFAGDKPWLVLWRFIGVFTTVWAIPCGVYALARNAYPLHTARRLEIDDVGLSIDGHVVATNDEVLTAYLEPNTALGPVVHVRLKRQGTRSFRLDDEAQAERLLEALGSTAPERAAVFWVRSRVMRRVLAIPILAWLVTALFVATCCGLWWAWPVIPPLLLLGLFRTRMVIGADGVHLSWLGWTRFFPYAKISHVTDAPEPWMVLAHPKGRRVRVDVTPPERGARNEDLGMHAAALVRRLNEAHKAYRARSGQAEPVELLARAGRTPASWVDSLKAVGTGRGGGYRAQTLSEERLWRIVDDAAAEPDLRAGAAIVLKRSLGGDSADALRRVARACAHPELRIALESLAAAPEEEEPALVKAISPLAAEAGTESK